MSWLTDYPLSLTAWGSTLGSMAAGVVKFLGLGPSDRRAADIARDSLADLAKTWVCERAGINPEKIKIVQSRKTPGAAMDENWKGGLLVVNPKLLQSLRNRPGLLAYEQRQIAEFDQILEQAPEDPEEISLWLASLSPEVRRNHSRLSRNCGWSLTLDEWKFLFAHELAGHYNHHDALLNLGNDLVSGVGGMLLAGSLGSAQYPWTKDLLQLGAWFIYQLFISKLVSRWMERRADREAVALCPQGGPLYFKRVMVQTAFEAIDRQSDQEREGQLPTPETAWVRFLDSWSATHPDIRDRLRLSRAAAE